MKDSPKIYTVSQVNWLVKGILENNLPPRMTVAGELTGWKEHGSGHCYFSLKDEDAVLPCVMWKSDFVRVKFRPENGLAVLATGSIDVYVAGGKYQLYVETLAPAGVGALQLAFEQMFKRLQAQGLFAEEHKKALPPYPQRIGIITSESGAALADISTSIWNRWPCVKLYLYPVPVQGEGAAEKIAAALREVNARNQQMRLDILIVGRGGGSLEDLWAFNEEVVARAIYDSKIPVISAVGHEIDTTIADLVADKRASTPTKAGVVAVPDMQEVLGRLAYLEENLSSEVKLLLQNSQQQSDELAGRLAASVKNLLAQTKMRLYAIQEQVVKIEPHRLLKKVTVDLNNLNNRAANAIKALINKAAMLLTEKASLLAGLNPKQVLQRGYSITTNKKTGLLVRALEDVQMGDLLLTELKGEKFIESKVTKK
jgi:exodeoxyribonuclease VII large subunit